MAQELKTQTPTPPVAPMPPARMTFEESLEWADEDTFALDRLAAGRRRLVGARVGQCENVLHDELLAGAVVILQEVGLVGAARLQLGIEIVRELLAERRREAAVHRFFEPIGDILVTVVVRAGNAVA